MPVQDDTPELEALLDLSANAPQREFIFAPEDRLAFYGGIRNGKTIAGVARVLLLCELWPGNVALVCRKTYQELRDTTWLELLRLVRKRNGGDLRPGPYVAAYRDWPAPQLELRNGSVIMARYADNTESLMGLTLGVCYIDQAEFVAEEIYTHLETRLNLWTPKRIEECRRSYGLEGTPRGMMFITGNPAPGWVYRRYKLGLDSGGKPIVPNPYRMIEASTEANIKNLGEEYLERMLRTQTQEWVSRYVKGDWTTFEGQIYKVFEDGLHVVDLGELPWPRPPAHWRRYLGWDHGSVNPTACVFVAVEGEHGLVYNEYYAVGASLHEHAKAVLALCEGDAVPRGGDSKSVLVHMDPATAGDYSQEGRNFMELYAELGILGLPANKNVSAGIQYCTEWLIPDKRRPFPAWHPRHGQLGSPKLFFVRERTRSLRHELPLYEWESKSGMASNESEKPRKYLDHALDAWRYAMMAIRGEASHEVKVERVRSYGDYVRRKVLGEEEALEVFAARGGRGLWG